MDCILNLLLHSHVVNVILRLNLGEKQRKTVKYKVTLSTVCYYVVLQACILAIGGATKGLVPDSNSKTGWINHYVFVLAIPVFGQFLG